MGALSDLKILDFSMLLPGPYATLMLADMGAEVLKISSPSRVDYILEESPLIEGTDITACTAWLGRNKKTMFLNLKTEEGKAVVKELVKEYDIVLEQFRHGVMDKLGLGYEDLKKQNPNIIYCSLTGYGQTGPLKNSAGHDMNFVARSGIMSHSGKAESGPALINFQIGDIASGAMNAVIGILAAVNYRKNTGKGQYIDIAMADGCVPFNTISGANFLVSGIEPKRESEPFNGGFIYDYYETKDGKYLSIAPIEPQFWSKFCIAIDREDLIKETAYPKDVQTVKTEIRGILKTKTQDEWMKIFKEIDSCIEPVVGLKEALLEDENFKAREMIVDVKVPLYEDKSVKQMATAIKLSESPCQYETAGYPVGYHTKEIVEKLGLDYDELKTKGVFE